MSRTGDFWQLEVGAPSVIGIGVFDGVHLGHSHLIKSVVKRARSRGCLAVAVTIHPRPRELLRPDLPSLYLTTLDERVRLLSNLGLDAVSVLSFTREVAETSAEEFVRELCRRYQMVELWAGPDFALGRNREGTIPVLRSLGARMGFEVMVAPRLTIDDVVVSSSQIRRLLADGDVGRAAALLGRAPSVAGPILHGSGRGRTLGFPTANVAVPANIALPADGIYAVWAEFGGERLRGAASIGIRPTFDSGARTLEVYLLDFDRDVYGQTLRVEFVERLRQELRFPSAEALVEQIRRDVELARQVLGE